MFDRTHPAPGVKVMGTYRAKAHISMSQQRLARTPEKHHDGSLVGVMSTHMIGGAQGLGMISTVISANARCKVVNFTKGCAPGTIRPGSKRRGHSHRPRNMAFSGGLPTEQQVEQRELDRRFKHLRQFHAHLCSRDHVPTGLLEKYVRVAKSLRFTNPMMADRVSKMEALHFKTITNHAD